MKILFLHLSDIHIEKKEDGFATSIEDIVKSINHLGELDECIIIISGDITKSGKPNEFKIAGRMIGSLINRLKDKRFGDKWINVLVVPGNHDLDLSNNHRTFEEIIQSLKNGKERTLIDNDIKSLENFYKFAYRNNCFKEDKETSYKTIRFDDININIMLINSAIFSLEGSSNQDMGIHYLSNESIYKLVPRRKGDLNIAIMHHSNEWYVNTVKERLRQILCDNYSIVFHGHEHNGFSESRKTNNKDALIYVQGNTLSGDKKRPKGFISLVYDTNNKSVEGYSFTWDVDFYNPKKILDEVLKDKHTNSFISCKEFINHLKYDDNKNLIDQYFVFPSLSYDSTDGGDRIKTIVIDDCKSFIDTILENDKTIITGGNKAGKSTLAKLLYQILMDSDNNFVPLILESEDLEKKKISRIIEYAFKEQYEEDNNSYNKFLQFDREKRVLIIDDAGKIVPNKLDIILENFDYMFSKVILFSEEKVELNIKKQVVDALSEKKIGKIGIRPFLYVKRKELISKIYNISSLDKSNEISNKKISELNNIISSQIRYFNLDPEFIISFVTQYMNNTKLNFAQDSNIFNIVYENSIKSKIIANTENNDVNAVFSVMEEIAFYMHFEKQTWITIEDLSKVITVYNKDFRQNIKIRTLLDIGEKSRIIIEKDSKIRFKDNNLLAYFVAKALNKKYYYEEIDGKIEYLLSNLCFGINSDIILFMALISSNHKVLGVILQCAYNHFEHIKELSFDENNIPFLCQSDFTTKDTAPDEKEKKQNEESLAKYEEELKASELVELVDNYDYDENDIETIENQLFKSIKYIEILSKILPAFSHNMKSNQQDELVKTLYTYTNRFIYQLFIDISDNYEEFIEMIFNNISEIRKQKNINELNKSSVNKLVEQIAISIVASLYQLVSSTSTTKQTITALNAFDFSANSNYLIMNLMMVEKTGNLYEFQNKAIKIYEDSEIKLVKSLVKLTVRNFFLYNDIKLAGDGQALFDKFFGASERLNNDKKRVKIEMAKNKIRVR